MPSLNINNTCHVVKHHNILEKSIITLIGNVTLNGLLASEYDSKFLLLSNRLIATGALARIFTVLDVIPSYLKSSNSVLIVAIVI